MSCIGDIRKDIEERPLNAIFGTREFVKYGLRNTVDQAMYVLVKIGWLDRLSRGIFKKAGAPDPTLEEIAEYRARSFGRNLVSHPETLIRKPKIKTAFSLQGGSSKISMKGINVDFVGTCNRKMHGDERKLAQTIRTLWHIGRKEGIQAVASGIATMKKKEISALINQAQWMPAWLSDQLQIASKQLPNCALAACEPQP